MYLIIIIKKKLASDQRYFRKLHGKKKLTARELIVIRLKRVLNHYQTDTTAKQNHWIFFINNYVTE